MASSLIKKINGFEVDLLWTNPRPNEAFTPKTISLDLSGYSKMIVSVKNHITGNVYSEKMMSIDGTRQHIDVVSDYIQYRRFVVNNNGVNIEDGYFTQPYGSVQIDNNRIIPYKIYGIK